MSQVVVVEYDPRWPQVFEMLSVSINSALEGVAVAIEHVGSTSVPGLVAKPIIDIDVVVPSRNEIPVAIKRLSSIGYTHRGNLGIEDREAFRPPMESPRHHLYVCPASSLALRNHLAVRNALRANRDLAERYAELKRDLAQRFAADRDRYMTGKTEFLMAILERNQFSPSELEEIRLVNDL